MADEVPPASLSFPRLAVLLGGGLGYAVARRTDAPGGGPERIRALFTDGLEDVVEVGLVLAVVAGVVIAAFAWTTESGRWWQRLATAAGAGALLGGAVLLRVLVVCLVFMTVASVVVWGSWGIGPWRGAVFGACLLGFLALVLRLAQANEARESRGSQAV